MNIEKLNRLLHDDAFNVMRQLEDKSVDLIFTSPPDISQTDQGATLEGYQNFQRKFLREFSRIVKDTGFIVLCQTDRKHKGEIISNNAFYIRQLLSHDLKLKDEKIVVRKPPVSKVDLYRFTFQYMSVWTRKGTFKRSGTFLRDIIVDYQDICHIKGLHVWTQTFCREVIEALSKEDEIVFDPFAATAPVLNAARQLNRRSLGCEIDPDIFNVGVEKLETGDFPV